MLHRFAIVNGLGGYFNGYDRLGHPRRSREFAMMFESEGETQATIIELHAKDPKRELNGMESDYILQPR